MLWLTWRQHRWQLIGITLVLAGYWGYLLYSGLRLQDALSACPALDFRAPDPEACYLAQDRASTIHNETSEVLLLGNVLPLLAGMFWGAPLISRELEQGTYRLAFIQSVSRRRWLAVKLGVLAGAAALLGALTGAVVGWSQAVYPHSEEPFGNTGTFSQSGLVPAATWVFALLAGAALGALLRRTLTAVAVTLVALPLVFGGLVVLRPHYLPPVEETRDAAHMFLDPHPPSGPGGWVYEISYLDQAGQELDSQAAGMICADPANTYPTAECLDRTGLRQRVVYQPANRYLWFQISEAGLLLLASAALVPVVQRRISRHLA